MPLGSRGPGGYPDWQRQATAVSGTLSKQANSIREGPTTIGPIYVANFASVTGTLITGGEPASAERCKVVFEWFTDKTLNQSSGRREFCLTQFVVSRQYQFLLPNQGAWVRITIEAVGEGRKHNCGWNIAATSREQLNPNPDEKPNLLSREGSLEPGVPNNWVPNYDFAGPVLVSYRASIPGILLHLITFNVGNGAPEAIATHQTTEGGVYEEFTWLTPLGSWEVQVFNGTAEKCTYAFQMTPAVSGSG